MNKVAAFKTGDLPAGSMQSIEVGDHEILIANVAGTYHAIYGRCTHYGAPLAGGALSGCRVICPWHHACFDVRTGDHLEAPGMDALPSYEVTVEGDQVFVHLPDTLEDRRTPEMTAADSTNDQVFAVIGGGAAGAYAVEGMRQAGYTGRIVMISNEPEVPYDRPNCSKDYLSDQAPEEWMPLRGSDFYEQHTIERIYKSVQKLDADQKHITFEDGTTLHYHQALVCTGGQPKSLPLEGADADNVFLLRSLADSRRLRDAGKSGQRVVVIGASFIGLEGAMSLHKLNTEVTVVGPGSVPFEGLLGEEIGRMIQAMHEQTGIQFRMKTRATSIEVQDGRAAAVLLENGERLPADVVLVGVGVRPATNFIQGVAKQKDGGLLVDAHLAVTDGLYAAGDIAYHPYRGQMVRIEHWKVACQQGRVAGRNMAGASEHYVSEPFFWSAQPGANLRYVGHATDFDRIEIDGTIGLDNPSFIAYYLKEDKVQAALGVGRDRDMCIVQERLYAGRSGLQEVRV